MMKKIVINSCYGGFGLSKEACDMYCEIKGISPGEWNKIWGYYENFYTKDIDRADEDLVRIVETLGDKASGACAELKVVEIPDDVEWTIQEYDGYEHVAEKHRTWG